MARRVIDLGTSEALLDLHSYGRPGRPPTPIQARTIALTVRRAPEVMVKVSGGARSLGGVQAHFAYIGRDGELGVEFDYGPPKSPKKDSKSSSLWFVFSF